MATRPENKLTYDDYVTFPEDARYELIDGEVYVVPGATEKHQRLAGELYLQVANHLKRQGGGRAYFPPFDVVLDPGDVLQPDLVFISDEDMGVLTEANVWGTPTWVVEVLSSKPERDRKLKLQRYEHFGVPEYWIIDPVSERVEIYHWKDGTYGDATILSAPELARPILPAGLEIDLTELFAD